MSPARAWPFLWVAAAFLAYAAQFRPIIGAVLSLWGAR